MRLFLSQQFSPGLIQEGIKQKEDWERQTDWNLIGDLSLPYQKALMLLHVNSLRKNLACPSVNDV